MIPVRWGVYRFAGSPATPWQELRAACLAGGLAGWTVLHFTAGSGPRQIVASVTVARQRGLRAPTPSEV